MRKMGFKVYQKYFNRMLPIRSISFDKYGNIEDITVDNRGMNGKYNVIPVFSTYRKESDFDLEALEILQSTGITDKNGNNIFEGDIIKVNHNSSYENPLLCEWDEYNACFKFTDKNDYDCAYYLNQKDLSQNEVIGNIYDNTELLK